MNTIAIIMTCALVATIILVIYDLNHPSRRKHCGSRMDRHYDIEEDSEVWQCPNCGRSRIAK